MFERRQSRRYFKNNNGAAMVEFAIIAMLFFVLLFGIIDFGLLLKDQLALSNVTREAARSAAVGTSETIVNTKITEWATNFGLQPGQIVVAPFVYDGAAPGGQVTVSISYTHNTITGGLVGLPNIVTLNNSLVMRRE